MVKELLCLHTKLISAAVVIEGMDELFNQSRKFFANDVLDNVKFTKRIAFNVIPHIDKFPLI